MLLIEVADAAREVARRRVARQVAREPVGGRCRLRAVVGSCSVTDTRFERVTFRTGNLTRYRCANRSKLHETPPRYGLT